MAKVFGTDGNDTLADGDTDDQIEGFAGDDVIENGFGDDWIFPGTGDDQIYLYPGHGDDLLVIEPDGGHDIVRGLDQDGDVLVFSGYSVIDSFEDVEAFTDNDEETGLLTIDVSAAEGGTPGEQTVAFLNPADFSLDSIGVNTERFDLHYEPVADPVGPIDPILDYVGPIIDPNEPHVVHTAQPASIEAPDDGGIYPTPYGNDFVSIPDE